MTTDTTQPNQIVFIDGSLQDIENILAGLAPGMQVVVLDPMRDGLVQIATALAGQSGLSAIHIISHGAAGQLQLGNAGITGANLADYEAQLSAIGAALSTNGDLLLYGCDVAFGEIGQAFIESLAALTGADVAASTDLTGAAFLNGDWVLEASVGSIETGSIAVADYSATLGIYYGTNAADNLLGSASADYLYGYAGNDTLNGGAGIDTMYGGLDNDIYYVDSASDVVNENAGEGTDWIYSSNLTGYSIYSNANVERLWLLGSAAGTTYYLYGNEGSNELHGNTSEVTEVPNYMYGYGGNDYLNGYGGNDTLYGDTGNDTLYGGAHNDYLSGGADNDDIRGAAGNDTMYGGSGLDSLYGGTEDDYIDGGSENDYIDAGTGNDTLQGGTGNDSMYGGTGDDSYYVDSASDFISESASAGTDTVFSSFSQTLGSNLENLTLNGPANHNATGNSLNNVLTGNSFNNVLDGGTGADTMDGGAGDDTYYVDDTYDATGETDTLTGGTDTVYSSVDHTIGAGIENLVLTGTAYMGTGNALANMLTGNSAVNYLQGLSGNDTLLGGDATDYLNGGADIDSMVGGLGNDYYWVDNASDIVFENSGEGSDWIYSFVASYTLQTNFENLSLQSGASNGYGNADGNQISGNSGANNLYGNDGNDSIYGGAGNDTLNGGLGVDTLDGGTGADNMNAGDLDDYYYVDDAGDIAAESYNDAYGGVDTVYASVTHTLGYGIEHLVLQGGSAVNGTGNANANQLTGNSAANQLYGQTGADTLSGGDSGTGIDSLYGGLDNDTYVVADAADLIYENASEGTDTVQSSVTYTLAANVENLTLTFAANVNGTGNTLDNIVTGNSGNNSLSGGDGNDTIDGAAGTDTLNGGIGDDVFIVDSTGDTIADASGTDRVDSSVTFSLAALGTVENLTLTGGGAIDGTGNALANVLTGNIAANRLDGGLGNDTMVGGTGNDTYVVNATGDVVTEGSGAGTDTIETGVTLATLADNVENLTLTGSSNLNATGNSLNNLLTGNTGLNVLDGGAGADTMVGGTGNDTYYVDNAGDVITEAGGAGTDTAYTSVSYTVGANVEYLTLSGIANINGGGNTGTLLITGNSGDNVLTAQASGNVTLDGGLGTGDVARLSGVQGDWGAVNVSGAQATITKTASGQVVTLQRIEWLRFDSGLDVAVVMGQNLSGTPIADTITGGAGNDTINGLGGADSMVGLAGDDIYYVDNAGDVVTEAAAGGYDQVISTIDYTLAVNVENLYLSGSALNGTGNAENNYLAGTSGNNSLSGLGGNDVLDGGAGNDTMSGGTGDDTFYVDSSSDTISEAGGEGTDWVYSSAASYTLSANVENLYVYSGTTGVGNSDANLIQGNSTANTLNGAGGNDTIYGYEGNDAIDGGTGDDSLIGGTGDDYYYVDSAADVVSEGAGEGTDVIVSTSASYTVTDSDVEYLWMNGATLGVTYYGYGNSSNNVIDSNSSVAVKNYIAGYEGNDSMYGYGGDDTFDGGSGNDFMVGGADNDTYIVDSVSDAVVEASANGTDSVQSSVTYALSDYVENLTLTGFDNTNATGNAGDNVLTGNAGANQLVGAAGSDSLFGGDGDDALTGGDGSDLLDGGDGYNIANFSGSIASYRFGNDEHGIITVQDMVGAGGTDLLANIQKAVFADTEVTLASAGQFGQLGVTAFTPGQSTTPSLAMLEGGGHVVVWEQSSQTYYQRYDAFGSEIGGATQLGTYFYDADVAALADGGFAISYTGYGADVLGYTVRATRFDAAGNIVDDYAFDDNTGWDASIAGLAGGGFAVTWNHSADTYAAVVDAGGSQGASFNVPPSTSGDQYYSAIAATNAGFVVTWYDSTSSGHTWSRRFDAAGNALGVAVDASGTWSYQPVVTGLADGGHVVFWQSWDGSSDGIKGQRYNADGSANGGIFTVNTTTASAQGAASAAATPDGGFIVVWESEGQDGSDYGIYGQRYAANGSALGAEFQVNGGTQYGQRAADIEVAADGSFIVVWRSEGGSGGIFTQRFAADGSMIGGISVTGGAADETISTAGAIQAAIINGEGGNDALTGGNLADSLAGGAGNDTLTGGSGADTLAGGSGNDIYVVDALDVIVENDGEGVDEIRTSVENYVLPDTGVENLVINTGTLNGTGNSLANILVGNAGANVLTGSGGNDTLLGGQGGDLARFSSDMAEYVFGVTGNGTITVRHLADGGDGTDTLNGIQAAIFAGGQTVLIDTLAAASSSERLSAPSQSSNTSATAPLADGGSLVVWYGYSPSMGLYSRTVDASGAPTGTSDQFVEFPTAGYRSVDNDKVELVRFDGGYAAIWTFAQDADGSGPNGYLYTVQGQLFDLNGAKSGATFDIATGTNYPDNFWRVDAISLDNGGFMVLHVRGDNSSPYALTAEHYGANGAHVVSRVLSTTHPNSLLALPDGGYIEFALASEFVAEAGGVPAHWDYWNVGQRYNAFGTAAGTAFQVTDRSTQSNGIDGAQFTTLDNGDHVLTWLNYNGTDNDIVARVFDDTAGQWAKLAGDAINVAGDSAFSQEDVTVASIPGRGFVVAWTHRTSSQADVYARVFDNTGVATSDVFRVNSTTDGNQDNPSINVASDGGFTIHFNDASSSGLYFQRYDADGRKIGGLELTGTAIADTLKASDALQSVSIDGLGGNDSIAGGAAADTLDGGSGNDTMDGAGGVDSLAGGLGNDTYVFDGSGDSFVEAENQGTDTVLAYASYTLPETSIENITLAAGAAGALNATGNARANVLVGNAYDNQLDGRGGNDNMRGGAGNDIYVVDSAGDVVTEDAAAGIDTVRSSVSITALAANVEILELTGTDPIQGTGNALDNTISGNNAANLLEGRQGNDLYLADALDTIIEVAGEGTDTVRIDAASYSLAGVFEVENLEFAGANAANGTGNGLANLLTGNVGNDTLNGAGGNDTLVGGSGIDSLIGGTGDDSFDVDHLNDVTHELADEGIDIARSSVSYALSTNATTGYVENLVLTGSGDIDGTGNALANTLTGNAGANRLDGGAGADQLLGGAGNDTYVLDDAGDTVTELTGGGSDTVETGTTLALLADNVENLLLTGSGNINGSGNALANVLTGNSGNNTLDGLAGADTMAGGAGNDTYIVDNESDIVTETAGGGTDTVKTSLASYLLPGDVENLELTGTTSLDATGNDMANTITGNTLNNLIDGGLGNDTMRGGKGDDTYIVDSLSDLVVETFGQGTDTVVVSVSSYVLPTNVEYLQMAEGTAPLSGKGNNLSNIIVGNDGDNTLDGGLNDDIMIGGPGNDVYKVDNANDLIIENLDEGIDRVDSTISFDLASNVEDLTLENIDNITLLGSGDNNATGNELNNVLIGNNGNNLLDGRGGDDSMTGGLGNDSYIVEQAGDVVTELASQGTDLVRSTLSSYTLGSNFENLTLEAGALNGTGNELDNLIIGNDADNQLFGMAGDDTLDGGKGADTLTGGADDDDYYIDNAADVINELANGGNKDAVYVDFRDGAAWGNNYVFNLPTNVEDAFFAYVPLSLLTEIIGNVLDNKLEGNDGANKLNGGAGADTMKGGKGNDIYVVDTGGLAGDKVEESSDEGDDTVEALVDGYTLGSNLENLTLLGGAKVGTGNLLGNNIVGNATAGNVLNGGGGADTMTGGAAGDTYYVDTSLDVIIDTAGGVDKVIATGNYALGANLENLDLTGIDNINGYGNTLDNTVAGNNGNNLIDGGSGVDTASYAAAVAGVNANLGTGQATGGGGNDTLINVEGLVGSNYGDSLTGNTGVNVLNGGVGADTMAGGAGSDVYYVDDGNDVVVELDNVAVGGGVGALDLSQYAGVSDTVNASINYSLGGFVENLQQIGNSNINGTGNDLRNDMAGNNGNNWLQGLGDIDTLSGGLGNDTLDGGAGNDLLKGEGGNDSLEGGLGEDTAIFVGLKANYTVGRAGNSYTVTDNVGTEGVDTLTNVEKLQFSDSTVSLGRTPGDYNGDGKSDILIRNNSTGMLWQYQLNGTAITGQGLVGGTGVDWQVVGNGDYNGDGKSDILIRNDSTGMLWQYQLNGTAITGQGLVGGTGVDWKVVGNGDYNGDGKSDILIRNDSTGMLWQYQLNGTAIVGGGLVGGTGVGWKVVGNGDYNGDGKSDILIRNDSTGMLWQYQLNGTAIVGQGLVGGTGVDWKVVGNLDYNGDYNGDGKSDILIRNDSTGMLWEYQLNGTAITGEGLVGGTGVGWGVVG
jgi:Ca2+-binding RTX toxin-like protein